MGEFMGGNNVTGSSVVNGLDRLVKQNNHIFGSTGREVQLWKDKPYPY